MDNQRKFSVGTYGLAIIGLLMPFFSVSCGGQNVLSMTGFQVMTGTQAQGQSIGGSAWMWIAFLALITGCVVSYLGIKIGGIAAGAISVVCLFMLKFQIDGEIAKQMGAPNGQDVAAAMAASGIRANFEFGYWWVLLLSFFGAFLNWHAQPLEFLRGVAGKAGTGLQNLSNQRPSE